MAMLEVKDLEVYYGMIQAIKGISFEVNEGEVIALIGANGAGKTTTLHTITGLLSPKKGHVIFEGQDITRIPYIRILKWEHIHAPIKMRLKKLWQWFTNVSHVWRRERTSLREHFPAESSRCLPWDVH